MKRIFCSASMLFLCCVIINCTSALSRGAAEAKKEQGPVARSSTSIDIVRSTEVLKDLENDYMKVVIYSDATADLLDKKTGTKWQMGPVMFQDEGPIDVGHVWQRTERMKPEQYPGRFRGVRAGDSIRFTLLGYYLREMGTFKCDVELDGPWLEFRLSEIDEKLPSLVFPPPIESQSMVFPRGVGQLVRKPMAERRFLPFISQLNMRWFGGLNGDNGWIAIFHKEFADAGVMAAQMSASPAWLKSMGKWSYPRSIRYRFTGGGYVGLAKAYRAWAIENGLYKSLKEKMKEKPALQNMLGGRRLSISQANPAYTRRYFQDTLTPFDEAGIDGKLQVSATHAQAKQIIEEARALGMKKGFVILRGWIQGGYDWSHPDIWPPAQELGTIEELKELCSLSGGISVGLHDNYQDIYEQCPSFPNGVVRLANGDLLGGGYWMGGQAYILNSGEGLRYARRNWANLATLNPSVMYIDTTTAVQNYESYDPGNLQTRAQDVKQKTELLKFFSDKGVALGSEWGADFGILYQDCASTRHSRVAGESVPLWPLVFHDAVFSMGGGSGARAGAPGWLETMLWGYVVSFRVNSFDGWKKQADDFKSTLHVDRWLERIGAEEMTDHKFLTDDFTVEQTTFGNGLSITVNFSDAEKTVGGVTIPAYGYVIRE